MKLALGNSTGKGNLPVAGIVTSDLKLLHKYDAGAVVPVSDGAAYFFNSSINFDSDIVHNYLSGDTAHTYSFWALRETSPIASWEAIMSKQGVSGWSWIIFNSDPSAPKLYYEGDTNSNSAFGTIPNMDARWNHYVVTANSGTVELYQNGMKMATTDSVIGVDHTINCLGDNGAGSNYFRGYMCNVGIWERALTQAEIKDIMFKNYAGLTTSNKANLLHWWNLDASYDERKHGGTFYSTVFDNHHGGSTSSFGPELVSNGDFSDGTTGWTKELDADGTDSGITMEVVNSGLELSLTDAAPSGDYAHVTTAIPGSFVIGTTYKIEMDIIQVTQASGDGLLFVRVGTSNSADEHGSGSTHIYYGNGGSAGSDSQNYPLSLGRQVWYHKATHAHAYLVIGARHDVTNITIDNVSVKEVLGNTGQMVE